MWLMSALTPAVLATSYRFSVWMRGDSFSSSDSGCPMPPAAPVCSRGVSTHATASPRWARAAARTDDADFDAVRRLHAGRAPRQLRLLLRVKRGVSGCCRSAGPKSATATRLRLSIAGRKLRSQGTQAACGVVHCCRFGGRHVCCAQEHVSKRRLHAPTLGVPCRASFATLCHSLLPWLHISGAGTSTPALSRTGPPAAAQRWT